MALAGSLAAADRMIDYVPPSLLNDSYTPSNRAVILTKTNVQIAAMRSEPIDRTERFEAEFGIKQRNESAALNSVQSAKYQLDKTTFTLQGWLHCIEDSLRFDYGWNDLGVPVPAAKAYRAGDNPGLVDTLLAARFKSDVRLNLASESFVGVKLVLPLGD